MDFCLVPFIFVSFRLFPYIHLPTYFSFTHLLSFTFFHFLLPFAFFYPDIPLVVLLAGCGVLVQPTSHLCQQLVHRGMLRHHPEPFMVKVDISIPPTAANFASQISEII